MSNKRVLFSEEEKVVVRGLVLANKSIVESKKSDAVSVIEKRNCWDQITETFNSSGRFPVRTAIQLRKLWENVKTRRKQELAQEKKGRMKTGGGPYTPDVLPDPELDAVGVDIELRNAVDSDTVAASSLYSIIDGELYPIEHEEEVISTENAGALGSQLLLDIPTDNIEEPQASGSHMSTTPQSFEPQKGNKKEEPQASGSHMSTTPQSFEPKKGNKKGKEEDQRAIRNSLIIENEKSLHGARMEEARLRNVLLQQEISQGVEMFKAKLEEHRQRLDIMKVKQENAELKKEILTMEKNGLEKSS